MAVAYDAVGSGTGGNAPVASLSWTHTCSGADRLLKVGVSWADLSSEGITITGITYNGVALTQFSLQALGGISFVEMWYLVAPATGANTITITWSATGAYVNAGSVSLTGVDQATPLGTPQTATATSTTPSVNVTGVSTNNIVVDVMGVFGGATVPTITVGAGQAQRYNQRITAGSVRSGVAGSTEPSAAGTVTMSWTLSVSKVWRIIAAEVKEVAAVAATARNLMTMDCGT